MMNFQKHIDSYKNRLSSFENDSASFLRDCISSPFAIPMGLVIVVLLALRFRGSAVVGAPFMRAFIGRGIWIGLGCAFLTVTAVAILWSVRYLFSGLSFSQVAPWTSFRRVALMAGAVGFVINIFFTLTLSYIYDEQIRTRVARADHQQGVVFTFPDRIAPLTLRQRADGSYEHRFPLLAITDTAQNMLEAGEDHRHNSRTIGPDIVRLVQAPFDATGGSGISEQLAGLLFDLYPSRETSLHNRLYTKIRKALIGIRIDDVIADRKEQVRVYLELSSFGSISGHEVVGLQSAAEIFYGSRPEDLAPEALAELMARVKSPTKHFPYQRIEETAEQFDVRVARLHKRAVWFLQQAATEGHLSETERKQAEQRVFAGLRPADQVLGSVTHPRLFVIYRELRRLVPDLDSRRLEVTVGFDGRAQEALDEAARIGLSEIAPLVGGESADRVVVDGVVLGSDGAIRARIGLASAFDQMASQLKGETYSLARSTGVLTSMSSEVQPGMTAAAALAESRNAPAIALGEKVGLNRLEDLLRSQGFQTTGAYPFLPLGAGVSGSPLLVASVFSKFGYSHPGSIVIQPNLITEVRDLDTGAILFRPQFRSIFEPEVCADVRRALEQCAVSGTAHLLAPLARGGRLNAKTGTAAFTGKDGQLEGRGGSWVVVNDGQTTIAIRIRWQSGRPFGPEGGQSAAVVAKHLIQRLRAFN